MNKALASPSVSIAMATYNGEKYIREQLDSLAAQTLLPMELVVTDDGSTDRTLEILNDFKLTSPFEIRIFENQDRLNHADNFFKAASLCRGDWVAFCDQDDIWTSSKIQSVSRFTHDPDVMLISHNAQVIGGNGERLDRALRYFTKTRKFSEKKYWSVYSGFTITFRRAAIMKYLVPLDFRPFCDFCIFHDGLVFLLSTRLGKFVGINQFLANYRRHDGNASMFYVKPPYEPKVSSLNSAYGEVRNRLKFLKAINLLCQPGERLDLIDIIITARNLRYRILMYSVNRFWSKVRVLRKSVLAGVYSNSSATGLGYKAFLLDMLYLLGYFRG